MRGVNIIIGEIYLISIVIVIISFTLIFYQTILYKTGNNLEQEEKARYCNQMSNFMISEAVSKNITVLNTGGTELNIDNFLIYVSGNNVPYAYVGDSILDIGESVTFELAVKPPNNSEIKIIGDCESGDIFVMGSVHFCGDANCDPKECSEGCALDCNVAYCCGNGYCDSAIGENNVSCASDCP
ncbi:MAG: hypothetical protein DRP06_02755 [Candidatus Aenigmatarchaeota archaeon]|nr:MAG: hypothetical protein DRP06_02755 [Candidatus Aenigmarchaeota archaeon]